MIDVKRVMKEAGYRYAYSREDLKDGQHYAVIKFPSGGGERRKVEVRASILGSNTELERILRDNDAVFPFDEVARKDLFMALRRATPDARQRYASATGWSSDMRWFGIGMKIVGRPPAEQLPPREISTRMEEAGKLGSKGGSEKWAATVGKAALNSSAAIMAICVALASPLLNIVNHPSFAICLYARTRSGKTIASLCGASLTGIGHQSDLLNWNATDAAIEARLPESRDTAVFLDDISTMDAVTDTARYVRLRKMAYLFGSNQGKARSRSYNEANGIQHARHRTIILTSSEEPITSLANKAKQSRQGGEGVRLIELKAVSSGQDDIFDRMERHKDLDKQRESASSLFKLMVAGCSENYGCAYRRYINSLIGSHGTSQDAVEKIIMKFVDRVVRSGDGREVRDLAYKFGLLFAGGILGVRHKVVPWQEKDVRSAITRCYRRARKMISDDAKLLRSGIRLLRQKLAELPTLSKGKKHRQLDNYVGYKLKDKKEHNYVVRNDYFIGLFPNAGQRRLVQGWLLSKNIIEKARGRGNGKLDACPKGQIIWPDGIRRRSLRFARLPKMSAT